MPYAPVFDPDGKNEERADVAAKALKWLQAVTGADDEDALCDMLCNLRHCADRDGFDFCHELSRAMLHYRAETERA